MKFLKSLILTFTVISSTHTFASSKEKTDYYADYYNNENALLFKIRGFYASTSAKSTNLPDVTNAGNDKPEKIAKMGYGFDSAMTVFVTDNFAAEVSLGFSLYKTRRSVLDQAVKAYGSIGGLTGKKNQIYMIPFTVTAQYHIAPFGGLRPYAGIGYNGTYMYTRSGALRVNNGHGPVLQAGIDFIAMDDSLVTFDIKQYFLKSKFVYKKEFLKSVNDVGSKTTWNPLVISLGFGFKF